MPLVDQLQELAFADHGVAEIKPCEFDLPRVAGHRQIVQGPVVKGPVVGKFQGAERVGDPLQCIGNGVGVIVHRVDAPSVAGAVVAGVQDAVQDRVAHVHVPGSHVDLGPQDPGAIGEFPGPHAAEQIEIFRHRPVAVWTVLTRFGEGAAVASGVFGGKIADIGLAGGDQMLGVLIQLLEIIRGKIEMRVPVKAQPADIVLDGIDILLLFLGGVGVIEAKMAAGF